MLLFSPRWLFLIPGLAATLLGGGLFCILSVGSFKLGAITLDSGSLAISSMTLLVGVQLLFFSVFVKIFSISEGFLPKDPAFEKMTKLASLERIIFLGAFFLVVGLALLAHAIWLWADAGFGPLSYSENMRRVTPVATLVLLGVQTIFSGFFISVLGLKTTRS